LNRHLIDRCTARTAIGSGARHGVTIEKVGVDGGKDYPLIIDDKQADLVGLLVIAPGLLANGV
jgi:hypothetical protein